MSQAKLTPFQQILLLKQEKKLKKEVRNFMEKCNLPDLSKLKIPILAKKKPEKISLLTSLQDLSLTKEEMTESLKDLNQKIIVPAFENAIHSCRFEIVEWNKKVSKYAGIYLTSFKWRKR